jgi:hypothetical protein
MSWECVFAALVSSVSTFSRLMPCWRRALPISVSAEETAAEELNDVGAVGAVGGVTGLCGLVGGAVGGCWRGEVGEVVGGACCVCVGGCEGRDDGAEPVGVCTVSGAGVELVAVGAEVAVLLGAAGESEDGLAGAVTLTNPGAAPPPVPGSIGALRFGAPSRTAEVASAGLPCRIPGATKAKAAMAAVDRLPMAIGAGRSGLNGLRARWRAL